MVAPVPPLLTGSVLVIVPAEPSTSMFHVPVAPVPSSAGMSVPIARPRLVRASEAVVAFVPPDPMASLPVIDSVPEDVIGPPEKLKPVVPPSALTLVTLPEATAALSVEPAMDRLVPSVISPRAVPEAFEPISFATAEAACILA